MENCIQSFDETFDETFDTNRDTKEKRHTTYSECCMPKPLLVACRRLELRTPRLKGSLAK